MSESTDRPVSHVASSGCIDTRDLQLEWSEAPWDTAIYGFMVLQITRLEVRGRTASEDLVAFERAREATGSGLVSCRLQHDRLRESMLLEEAGFRFIEMLYLPEFDLSTLDAASNDGNLQIVRATQADLPQVLQIAGTAFRNERFHIDPRLSPELSDRRYQSWARSSLRHPTQQLFVISDGEKKVVAFFVTELLSDGTCYWHLNAVAPEYQGNGYGRRAWSAMLEHARVNGARRVRTSIVARNHRVLNLYARLGFRFPPPLMTFHWVRPA